MIRAKPTVVVTQAEGLAGPLADALRARGVEVLALPTISIEPPQDFGPLDAALGEIDRFDWIVFTSRHAVDAVGGRPSWAVARQKALPSLRVAAAGKATAARLMDLGVTPLLVPTIAGGASLASSLIEAQRAGEPGGAPGLAGVRVLWPRSDIARRELPDALRSAGAEVVAPIAYRTVRAGPVEVVHADAEKTVREGSGGSANDVEHFLERLQAGTIDALTFLSPSSARNLCALLALSDLTFLAERTAIASLGPTTSEALRELGAPPAVESASRTAEDLAATLVAYLESPGPTRP